MTGTFSDSWQLTKTSFRLIREDRALLIFPLVGGLSILGVIALLILGEFWLFAPGLPARGPSGLVDAAAVVLFLVTYLAMVFLSVYCTAALVGAATLKLSGQQPSAADGWRIARARIGRLVVWALIAATVALVIQAIASRTRGVGGLVIRLVGGVAWGVATYFIVPVILYEDLRPWPALKRSGHLFTSTLGRTLVSNLALGLLLGLGIVVAVIVAFIGILLAVGLVAGGSLVLGLILIGVGLAIGVTVALVGAAAEGILQAALYRYATTGQIDPGLFPPGYEGASPLPSAPAP